MAEHKLPREVGATSVPKTVVILTRAQLPSPRYKVCVAVAMQASQYPMKSLNGPNNTSTAVKILTAVFRIVPEIVGHRDQPLPRRHWPRCTTPEIMIVNMYRRCSSIANKLSIVLPIVPVHLGIGITPTCIIPRSFIVRVVASGNRFVLNFTTVFRANNKMMVLGKEI